MRHAAYTTTASTTFAPVNEVIASAGSTQAHFSDVFVQLSGEFVSGEIWTITVDGHTYTYPVPFFDTDHRDQRTLSTIALGLAALINGDPAHVFAAVGPTGSDPVLRVKDASGTNDPFTLVVKRGGGVTRGLIDIDAGNLVHGSIPVPIRVSFFFGSFILPDQLDFTAYPTIQSITSTDGGVATCTSPTLADPLNPLVDPGSVLATDPFRSCSFTVGTYVVQVGSFVDWAPTTRNFRRREHVPYSDGFQESPGPARPTASCAVAASAIRRTPPS